MVSNIPYSITGSIFEKVFYSAQPPEGILTLEESIANRIFAKQNYKDISRITISANSFLDPKKKKKIPRKSFYPIPKINLALIKVVPKENIDPNLGNDHFKKFYLRFIAGIMPYKNKNVINALNLFVKRERELDLNKNVLKEILENNSIKDNKVFENDIDRFIKLSKILYNFIKNNQKND